MKINNNIIVKDNDSKIREKSFLVEFPLTSQDKQLMQDMLAYVRNSRIPELAEKDNLRPSVGISAIQVGVPKQMCAVVVDDIDKNGNELSYEFALINPKIISKSVQLAYLKGGEGCLSVESHHEGYIYRHARIKVEAYDLLQEKTITIRAQGYLAIVLQHEFDHFDGNLFYDHIHSEDPFKVIPDAIEI